MNVSHEVEEMVRFATIYGFCSLNINVPTIDVDDLHSEAIKLLDADKRHWSTRDDSISTYRQPTYFTEDWEVLSNPLGISDVFDSSLERFFSHPDTRKKLASLLGRKYKIWECSIRRAKKADSGLYFHQDSKGEVGLSIFLTDQPDFGGTTAVVPGSHRWPFNPSEIGIANTLRRPLFRPLLRPIKGKKGESFFFFKKTWHGRVENSKETEGIAIMIGLFPVGYEFRPFNCPKEVLAKLGPTLQGLLDPDSGFSEHADFQGKRMVLGDESDRSALVDGLYPKTESLWDKLSRFAVTFPRRSAVLLGLAKPLQSHYKA